MDREREKRWIERERKREKERREGERRKCVRERQSLLIVSIFAFNTTG